MRPHVQPDLFGNEEATAPHLRLVSTTVDKDRSAVPRRGLEPALPEGLKQLRIIVSPWRSGHTTVDLVVRRTVGGDHWDRRTGHLDLAVDPAALTGLSARVVLAVLASAPDH